VRQGDSAAPDGDSCARVHSGDVPQPVRLFTLRVAPGGAW